ncbi:MAG: Crp/Fnr family transcriptional regulator [Terracidiphilus sp.]
MNDKDTRTFGPAAFLSSASLDRKIVELEPEQYFFRQGDPSDSVYFLQRGRAKIAVVSEKGKQATISLLFPGDFFGEGSLAMSPGARPSTAVAVYACTALKISREDMIRVMHQESEFSDWFLSYVVARSTRTQADLVDHMFNRSEKRLARTLLMMAESGKPGEPHTTIPPITQETLAEMVGTTRSRISFFMNRFRSLGVIQYKDRIQVHKSRLRAVLVDQLPDYEVATQAVA